jgi:uncharacterized protein YdhG (YjbR/CyaY superfamily)
MADPAEIAHMRNWLQGYNPVAQTQLEFASGFSGVWKHDRMNLKPKDIAKLQSYAVKGLEQVFELMEQITFHLNSDVDRESLKKVYNFGVCSTEFVNTLK